MVRLKRVVHSRCRHNSRRLEWPTLVQGVKCKVSKGKVGLLHMARAISKRR